MSGYRTIVADPPWYYEKAGGYSWREGLPSGESRPMLSYGTMTVPEIAALPADPIPPSLCARCGHRQAEQGRYCESCAELLAEVEFETRDES